MIQTRIDGYPERTVENWKMQAHLGAFILEALQELGYVVVNKDAPDYMGHQTKVPVMIHATENWSEMQGVIIPNIISSSYGIHKELPNNLTGLFDTKSGRPVIKRSTNSDQFNSMLTSDFISGVDCVRQTGWRINKDVFNAILHTPWDEHYDSIPKEGSKQDVNQKFQAFQKEDKLRAKGKPNNFEKAKSDYDEASRLWAHKKLALKRRCPSLRVSDD